MIIITILSFGISSENQAKKMRQRFLLLGFKQN